MSCVRSRIIRHILPAPALFLALGAVLLCSVPALAADRTNPAGHTITANPSMAATANGDRLTNNGRIEATASGGSDAVGMGYPNFFTPLTGLQLANTGTITVKQTGPGDADGMRGGDHSTLTNSGTITSTATATGYACGMRGGEYSTLTNSGAITASATDYAYGMYADAHSSLTNSGAITASALRYAYGMYGVRSNTLTNSGAISVSATTNSAFGMYAEGDNSTLTNSGAITASATDYAYGMRANGNNTLTNSGAITASATDYAYGMWGAYHNILSNSGTITAMATNATGQAYGMLLNSDTATNTGLIRVSAPDPANAWELYNRSNRSADTVRITDWATDLRDFGTYKFFGSNGGTLDFSGSTFILRPGDTERGFVWGKEYAVADMAGGLTKNWGQGTVASVTAEVPWLRARLTGTDWRDQQFSLHPNFTRKTNIGQNVSRQGVALVAHQMFSLTDALGQFRNSSAPVAFTTASGPDLGPDSRPDENG